MFDIDEEALFARAMEGDPAAVELYTQLMDLRAQKSELAAA